MARSIQFVLSLALVCLLIVAAHGKTGNSGPQPKLGDPKTAVCRYMGPPVLDSYLGKRVPKITMMQLPSGKPLALVLWATDEGKPPVWFEELVKKSKKGDVYEVSYAIAEQSKQAVLDRVNEYMLKPGEDEENVLIFEDIKDEKAGTFKVSKFGTSGEMTLPQAKGSSGKMGPNEAMLKVLKDLKSGTSIEVTLAGSKIKTLKKYEPPKWAKFVKLTTQTVDGKELKAVEVDAYGNSMTLVMAAKDIANFMAKLRGLKEGSPIVFRSTKDDKDILWLNVLTIPPKGSEIPPEPTKEDEEEKKPDKPDKKGDKKTDKKASD